MALILTLFVFLHQYRCQEKNNLSSCPGMHYDENIGSITNINLHGSNHCHNQKRKSFNSSMLVRLSYNCHGQTALGIWPAHNEKRKSFNYSTLVRLSYKNIHGKMTCHNEKQKSFNSSICRDFHIKNAIQGASNDIMEKDKRRIH